MQTRIWPLPVRKINGIGPKTEARLARLHLHTIGDIAAQSRDWLIDNFGSRDRRLAARRRLGPRRPAGGDGKRAGLDEPRDHVRPRPASGARPGRTGRGVHRAVPAGGRRPAAQGLCRQDHRHQVALRRFPHRHARPDHRPLHGRRRHHPAHRRPVPQARGPEPPPAAAGRAGRQARAARVPTSPRCRGAQQAQPAPRAAEPRPEATLDLFEPGGTQPAHAPTASARLSLDIVLPTGSPCSLHQPGRCCELP